MHLDITTKDLLVVQELLHWIYTSEYSDREDYWLVREKKRAYLSSEAAQYVPSRCRIATVESRPMCESNRRVLSPWSLTFNVEMFITSIKYQLPELKQLAKEKYEAAMRFFWNSKEFLESAEFLWANIRGMEELKKYDEFMGLLPGDESFGWNNMTWWSTG